MTRFATAVLIGMVFWLFVLGVWFVIKRKKEEADSSFQEQLLLSGKRWEKREEEELSYLLAAAYLDQGSDGRKLGAVGSLLLGLLFILEGFRMIGEPRLEPRIGLCAAYVLGYAVLMLFGRSFLRLQTEKRMAEFLNKGMEEESSNRK